MACKLCKKPSLAESSRSSDEIFNLSTTLGSDKAAFKTPDAEAFTILAASFKGPSLVFISLLDLSMQDDIQQFDPFFEETKPFFEETKTAIEIFKRQTVKFGFDVG